MEELDSSFRRNDGQRYFMTCYEFIKFCPCISLAPIKKKGAEFDEGKDHYP